MFNCPQCRKPKMPWFQLCFDCNQNLKQKPACGICHVSIPEGHTLCKTHWKQNNMLNGKFYFNGIKVKSKSELLLLYFLEANGLQPRYEDMITLHGKEYHPDFILEKGEHIVIMEHFGMNNDSYNKHKDQKIKEYTQLCANSHWHFVWTDEQDIYNLKESLGKKLNQTPLKRLRWK